MKSQEPGKSRAFFRVRQTTDAATGLSASRRLTASRSSRDRRADHARVDGNASAKSATPCFFQGADFMRAYRPLSDELGAAAVVLPLSIHEVKPATIRKSMSATVPTANL